MRFVVLVLAVLVTGCTPTIIASTPRSVTLDHVNKNSFNEATQKAQEHCAQNGRDAEYVPDNVEDGNATWKCVDRQ